jgi:hypothetical protein
MNFRKNHQGSDIAALTFAAGCVPATKIALMYWEYRLHWPLPQLVEPILLLLALCLAFFTASYFPRSWLMKLIRVAAVGIWSYVAYFFVAFVPGCLWAPACV